MFNLLRRIQFPEGLQMHGPIIKGKTLLFAKDHRDILSFAHDEARQIIEQAQRDADEIRHKVREEVANSLQTDVQAIHRTTRQRVQELADTSSRICIEVCTTALHKFLDDVPEKIKVEKLVKSLLDRSLSNQSLTLECAKEQVDTVQSCLGAVLSRKLMIRKWEVKTSEDLNPFELRIRATKGSEIQVSIDNIMALYKREIENLQSEVAESINRTGEKYEEVD